MRDKRLLLVGAIGLSAVLLSGMFAVEAIGLGERWRMLWLYTVLPFLS